MSKRVLITGASGFSGRFLVFEALRHQACVFGLSRRQIQLDGVISLQTDLLDYDAVAAAVRQAQPEYVFHLAAQTPANTSGQSEQTWLTHNQLSTFNLFEALRLVCPEARIVLVSSSAVYGHVDPTLMPMDEHSPLQPTTLYGVSKASQELLAMRYASEYGMAIIRARPFNQIGSGEPAGMLTSTLATQVIRVQQGQQPPIIRMWHRSTARDFTDIRDTVRAYWGLAETGQPHEVYNVCSQVAVPIGVVAEMLLEIAGVEARIEETGGVLRRSDILTQAGDRQKIRAAIGWEPQIPLRQSLEDLLASLAR